MNNLDTRIILDLCGGTGSWSRPYAEAGYDVRVITLPNYDVTKYVPTERIYGVLAAPPCDQLSFARTKARKRRDLDKSIEVMQGCLRIIWECQKMLDKDTQKLPPLKFWALENPNCMMRWYLGKPAFVFDPFEFGAGYRKRTHLWGLFNEPKKQPVKCTSPKFDKLQTKEIYGEYYPTLSRQERRAITPPGFAKAFMEANR